MTFASSTRPRIHDHLRSQRFQTIAISELLEELIERLSSVSFHQKQPHLSTLILSSSMAFTNINRALPRLATSTIRSQNIFRPPRASPFNHTGFYVPGSRRTFLDSWLAKVERKIHEMERKEEEILQELERNKPGSRQRMTNTWLYKKRKEAEQKARALDKDLDERID